MAVELSYEALRKVQLQEKHLAALLPVEDLFYKDYAQYVAQISQRLKEKFSLEDVKVYENALKTLKSIVELRQQKILLKAMRDIRTNEINSANMAVEEKDLYIAIIKLLTEYEEELSKALGSNKTTATIPKAAEKEQEQGAVTVRVLVDLPEFVGHDAKPRGPYNAQQTITLDRQTAELLCKRKAAETLEQGAIAR